MCTIIAGKGRRKEESHSEAHTRERRKNRSKWKKNGNVRQIDEKVRKIAERKATGAKKVTEKADKEIARKKVESTELSGSKRQFIIE